MQKIKKGDDVIVLTGKDKGKRGKVSRVFPAKERAIIEGLNLIKKHVKPNPRTNEAGGIVTREATIHLSNVALYNPITKKADRVKIRILEDGRKVRCFKSNNELVDI